MESGLATVGRGVMSHSRVQGHQDGCRTMQLGAGVGGMVDVATWEAMTLPGKGVRPHERCLGPKASDMMGCLANREGCGGPDRV